MGMKYATEWNGIQIVQIELKLTVLGSWECTSYYQGIPQCPQHLHTCTPQEVEHHAVGQLRNEGWPSCLWLYSCDIARAPYSMTKSTKGYPRQSQRTYSFNYHVLVNRSGVWSRFRFSTSTGYCRILATCIRPQSSVTSLYGRYGAQ